MRIVVIMAVLGFCLCMMVLPSLSKAQKIEICDDSVSITIAKFTYPERLKTPKERLFQQPARYQNDYIFTENFEGYALSTAFHVAKDSGWRLKQGGAKKSRGLLSFEKTLGTSPDKRIAEDMQNWSVLGPFDFSDATEAYLNFYVKLGNISTNQQASLSVMFSLNGVEFYGYKLTGVTCDWFYRNFELAHIPILKNINGSSSVWIAFLPGSQPFVSDPKIALDELRLLVFNSNLPPKVLNREPLKDKNKDGLRLNSLMKTTQATNYKNILSHYAPYIVQELNCIHFGDYITSFDYDGDYVANNNWDNLGNNCWDGCGDYRETCQQARPLPSYVNASAIETATHYYLNYSIFHPADDFHCHSFHHENDLEGIIVMVRKDGSEYGALRMVQLQAHHDFYQYVPSWFWPPEDHGIYDVRDNVDGTITIVNGSHPAVFIEGGGHGIRSEQTGGSGSWYLHYRYTGSVFYPTPNSEIRSARVPSARAVGYAFLPIAAEMWQRRREDCGTGCMFAERGDYSGSRETISKLGKNFDGNTCMSSGGKASAPWNWSDNDNVGFSCELIHGVCTNNGDWFMDPAWYHEWQFNWDEALNKTYVYHEFLRNHLCGWFYGTLRKFDSPAYSYLVKCNVIVPNISFAPGKSRLSIHPNVEVKFAIDTKIQADGQLEADGTTGTIRLVSERDTKKGIKLNGYMRLKNGGSIRFP